MESGVKNHYAVTLNPVWGPVRHPMAMMITMAVIALRITENGFRKLAAKFPHHL